MSIEDALPIASSILVVLLVTPRKTTFPLMNRTHKVLCYPTKHTYELRDRVIVTVPSHGACDFFVLYNGQEQLHKLWCVGGRYCL